MNGVKWGHGAPCKSGEISSRPHRTKNPEKVANWKGIHLFQGNLGSPGPKCVPAVGPSGLNVGGVGAMVRSSIVESS